MLFSVKSGEPKASTATETIPEGEGEGENPEAEATLESPSLSDEVKKASKEPEQDTKDIKTVTATTEVKTPDASAAVAEQQAADIKAPEASTSVEELQTTAGGEPNESVERSEEPSADNKNSTSAEKIDGIANQQGTVTQSPEESEKLFPPAAQERLLGLLGAILPQDSKVTLTILM